MGGRFQGEVIRLHRGLMKKMLDRDRGNVPMARQEGRRDNADNAEMLDYFASRRSEFAEFDDDDNDDDDPESESDFDRRSRPGTTSRQETLEDEAAGVGRVEAAAMAQDLLAGME